MTGQQRPAALMERGVVTLREEVMPGVWLLRLRSPRIAAIALPGQFVHIRCADSNDPLLRRPFSFCDLDRSRGTYDILFNVVGQGTRLLAAVEAGQVLEGLGPLGRPFSFPERGVLMTIGGGLGIAPFPLVAREAAARGLRVVWVNGAYTKHQLFPLSRLPVEVEAQLATDDGSAGFAGFVTDLLRSKLSAVIDEGVMIHACGPTPMLVALAALLRDVSESRGSAPPCEMSLEAPMGCALGTCLGCVVPATGWSQDGAAGISDGYLRVCMEGAVVDWRELDWERWPALGELVSRRAISVRPPADAVLVAS